MILLALILIPLGAGLVAYWLPSRGLRRGLLGVVAAGHAGLTAWLWQTRPVLQPDSWLAADALGLLFLTLTSILFLASTVYCIGYLRMEQGSRHVDIQEGFFFSNEPEAVFVACLLLFLASMTLVTLSQHFGLLWVGVEATTLASAPLIYFHRHHRSLEATWKYLLICSVGIALALLANFLLAVSAVGTMDGEPALLMGRLVPRASQLHPLWLRTAFLFFLVGYGTKMGLAPMHTWLPDAHSEAPSPVSALLSGALLNCAFLGILRAHHLMIAAGQGEFSQSLLVLFGLLSMSIAAVFIVRQSDFKRMLAYSSVEHMGILALGIGLGGAGLFGAMLHAVNHSFTKAALFLLAGNLLTTYRTKSIDKIQGARRVIPLTGLLWFAGFLAITGAPPFGTFLSELTILKAALDQGHFLISGVYLTILAVIFIGMANIVTSMTQGKATSKPAGRKGREPFWATAPSAVLMVLVLGLGLWLPARVDRLLDQAAQGIGPTESPHAVAFRREAAR